MKNPESGSEKVKKICDAIRQETIEPALEESRMIVEAAKQEALKIIEEANAKAKELIRLAGEHIAKEKQVFETALKQSSRQAIESLRQELEKRFFHPFLAKEVAQATSKADKIGIFVDAVASILAKEGLDAEIDMYLPQRVSAKEVASHVASEFAKQLIEKSKELTLFKGGIQLSFKEDNLTLDLSDKALTELLAEYIRKDLRTILFKTP